VPSVRAHEGHVILGPAGAEPPSYGRSAPPRPPAAPTWRRRAARRGWPVGQAKATSTTGTIAVSSSVTPAVRCQDDTVAVAVASASCPAGSGAVCGTPPRRCGPSALDMTVHLRTKVRVLLVRPEPG